MRVLARTWKYLGWKHLAVVGAGGVLIAMSVALSTLQLNLFRKHLEFQSSIYWYVPMVAVFVLAVALVEANAPRRRPRLRGYILAALVAGTLCIAGAYVAGPSLKLSARRDVPGFSHPTRHNQAHARTSAIFAIGFEGVMHCVIGVFVYARLRNSRLTARALNRRQARANEAASLAASARLESVRHRIDPGFLTQALEDIERRYATDPARADAELDELIEFLREAIPRTRAELRVVSPEVARDAAD